MNSTEYRQAVDKIMEQVHALHGTISLTMDDLGGADMARTAEWNLLYEAMRLTGVISDRLYAAMYPRPSALTEQCDADWGSATASQRCVRGAGHDMEHRDSGGHVWDLDGPRDNFPNDAYDVAESGV